MRNDFGTRPYKSRFNGKRAMKIYRRQKLRSYDTKLDLMNLLGMPVHGKKSTKKQSMKARRDESKGKCGKSKSGQINK